MTSRGYKRLTEEGRKVVEVLIIVEWMDGIDKNGGECGINGNEGGDKVELEWNSWN